jgi:hypothetical protein
MGVQRYETRAYWIRVARNSGVEDDVSEVGGMSVLDVTSVKHGKRKGVAAQFEHVKHTPQPPRSAGVLKPKTISRLDETVLFFRAEKEKKI